MDNMTHSLPAHFHKFFSLGLILLALSAGSTDSVQGQEESRPPVDKVPGFVKDVSKRPWTGLPSQSPDLAAIDEMFQNFVDEHGAPGASLAISKNGKLVYARGYGWVDLENHQAVEPLSQFRVASISKPITAVVIMRLVELGKLKITDKVAELLPLSRYLSDNGPLADSRWYDITIQHCLQHTGGWNREIGYDPMFQAVEFAKELRIPAPAGAKDVIRVMITRPLDDTPGEHYAYSNFGYCLLGRIIEEVTGKSYEEAAQELVLQPLGMKTTQLGRTLPQFRLPGEVKYYDEKQGMGDAVFADLAEKKVPWPYGVWNLEAMDSHGGWTSSAIDLVRFVDATNPACHPGISKPETLDAMFRTRFQIPPFNSPASPDKVYYCLGWSTRDAGNPGQFNAWHSGLLAGTSTLMVRRYDGLNWAVLFNSARDGTGQRHSTEIDPLLHKAVDSVQHWPEGDLFPRFGR